MFSRVLKQVLVLLTILTTVLIFKSQTLTKKYYTFQINKKLSDLSDKEKEYLENFFQFTVRISSFGYVLFGSKPMSFDAINYTSCLPVEGFDYMDDEHIFNKYKLKEGWQAWKKCAPQFIFSGFSLIECPVSPERSEIYLINHESFIRCVKENLEDFQRVLENHHTPEEILALLIAEDSKVLEKIKSHEALLGISLGYGRENAWLFYEKRNAQLTSFSKDNLEENIFIFEPMFKAYACAETEELLQRYFKEKKKIEEVYKEKNFLIPSLLKLTGH